MKYSNCLRILALSESSKSVLGDYCKIESGYPFKATSWQTNGVPVVKIKNVGDGIVSLEGCSFVSEEVASKASRFYVQEGDVLVSLTGYVGQVGRVQANQVALVNQRVGLVRPFEESELDFIFYFLRASRDKIESLATGSAQANVSPLDIMQLHYPDLSVEAKSRITSVLKSLDAKLAVNRRQSQLLEKIAQTIFKSWFIDFDPVHAKTRGEQPEGMDAETAALFPDSFEDSELGPIPAGWRQGALRDLAEINFGVPFKSTLFSSQSVGRPVIRIRDLAKGFSETYTTEIHLKEHVTAQGDLLIGMDGTFDAVVWLGPQSLVNQRVAIVSPHASTSQLFLKFAIQKELKLLEANATGTTVGHLSKGEIESLKVVSASIELIEKYRDSVAPVLSQMANLASQNRTLQELRDSLLPRLISGELEIHEEILGE